ncbi:transforming growth factor-beta receptor-associated protein 1 [Vigna radiata var. radiata]|uniref:Transforming growth factor-beta receptor-associated protein 1 n=1 Tax=Vigna radiata var. radiata TaxID=3916 RepID=A0A1S3VEE9_VIGRR|nr:transforming growth factor-beta receptor-associated protein 1 [Vigna radiata var. radiata]
MSKVESSMARVVLEPHAQFDLTAHSRASSIRSLALATLPDARRDRSTVLYVGTNSGTLFSLSADTDDGDGAPNDAVLRKLSFLRSVSVSDAAVECISVIEEFGKVLLLSNGALFLVDSELSNRASKLSFSKGVSLVTRRRFRNGESESLGLGLGSGSGLGSGLGLFQKLRMNSVKEGEMQSEGGCVFAVVVGKRLILAELVLGNRNGKNERDDGGGGSLVVLKEIQCIDGVVSAMVWLNDSIVVGTVNGYSLISCVTGQSSVIFSLPDVSRPPRLKLLHKEWRVLLLVDNVGVIVDAHGQPVGGSLVFRHGLDSVGEIGSYVVVVSDGKIELYHKRYGGCVQVLPFGGEGVGRCVVASEEDRDGRIVVVATATKVVCYQKLPSVEQIKDLLRKKNYKGAISLVEELESEGEMSKDLLSFVHAQVGFLLLFDLHFKEAVDHFLLSDTMQPSEVFPFIMRDPNRWSLLVPRNRYWGLHPPPAPLEDVIDDGLMTIQRASFLRKAGVETIVDNDLFLNPVNRADLLKSAIENISRYLEACREKDLTESVREGVDTLLMYLYRALNCVEDMERLASSTNWCVVEELEQMLEESGHLRTLAFLCASKGMSSKAVHIWRILARNYSSGLWKDPALENSTQDSGESLISGRSIAAAEASKILEESSDQELILQHLGWIADISQVLAVKVLTSEKREIHLSPDEVVTTIDPQKVEILQRYLQWLIEDQDCNDTQLHTLYALSLAKSAIEVFESENISKNLDSENTETRSLAVSKNSIFDTPVRERLQIFLQSSDLYDPEEVLYLIEGSELWLEKAILYRRLGQETLVLQILALKLEDSEAAEQYCAEIGRADAYMQLLEMYLDPQDGKDPMFTAAVRLLHNHGESLDPLQVLEKLSPDMPLQLASDTLLRMFRARVHHHRQGQIVHNLSRAVDIDARLSRLEERSRHVQIDDESLCDSCDARLGTKLFAMYPDDTVVCYKCYRRQGESVSVSGRNFKEDILFKPGWLVSR